MLESHFECVRNGRCDRQCAMYHLNRVEKEFMLMIHVALTLLVHYQTDDFMITFGVTCTSNRLHADLDLA